ncbi:MAG: hypothetical protein ACI4QM_01975 [Alphaproteobacteria bacterium]
MSVTNRPNEVATDTNWGYDVSTNTHGYDAYTTRVVYETTDW